MKDPARRWILPVLGIVALASSWLSIRPASEHRHAALVERAAHDPGSVTAEDRVMSKDDEGMTALALVLIGLPACLVVTGGWAVWVGAGGDWSGRAPVLGCLWIALAAGLHAVVWFAQ